MPRYVDAEKELAEMKFAWYPQDMDTTNAIGMYENFLKNAPSADVAPVVHAHWEITKLTAKWIFVCSHCRYVWYESYEGEDIAWKYCPDCGALMDERKEC